MSDTGPKREGERLDASLYLHPKTLARLGSFELRAKMIVEGVMSGQHRSPHQGVSVEFAQHRQYVSGDDIRHLDWKVYGRTDKLYLKQYQQETNLDLVVMVDSSGSMDFGSRSFEDASGMSSKQSPDGRVYWSKFDHATAIAAAMAYITLKQGDRVGLVVFADEVRKIVARSSQRGTWRQIVEALATQPVDRETDFGRVVDQTLSKVSNRCLIALVSDLFADADAVSAAMARIAHRGHDLILFQVMDRVELDFGFEDLSRFEGLEGEGRLAVDPRALRSGYLAAVRTHNAKIAKVARSFGFDYELVNTNNWLGPTLGAFVAHRNAQIKKRKYG